jgi:hypothetical protein
MPSDLDRVIKLSKRLESLLATRLGATGKGLHEKVSSVETEVDPATVADLRAVATVRNRLVHEDGYDRVDNRRELLARGRRAEKALERLKAPGHRRRPHPALVLTGALALLVVAFILLRWAGAF